jgi:hypothetical protein
MLNANKPFAEVLESSLSGWLAQSWQWDVLPHFGSIVTIQAPTRILFAVVHQIQTGSMDPVRYPFAYQKTEEELRVLQPQIFEFLKTTFSCLMLGYQEKGRVYYMLAPEPAKIHAFVTPLSTENAKDFFSCHNYLNMLLGHGAQVAHLDELLLAVLNYLASLNITLMDHLDPFMQRYSLLIGNDYRRVKLFLQRVEQLL